MAIIAIGTVLPAPTAARSTISGPAATITSNQISRLHGKVDHLEKRCKPFTKLINSINLLFQPASLSYMIPANSNGRSAMNLHSPSSNEIMKFAMSEDLPFEIEGEAS
jgi:hypothetical protein